MSVTGNPWDKKAGVLRVIITSAPQLHPFSVSQGAPENYFCYAIDMKGFQVEIDLQALPVGVTIKQIESNQVWWVEKRTSLYRLYLYAGEYDPTTRQINSTAQLTGTIPTNGEPGQVLTVITGTEYDWTTPGGGGGGYASLTGPGETASPGLLTQSGGFSVQDPNGNGIVLTTSGSFTANTHNFYVNDAGAFGVDITSSNYALITANNAVDITSNNSSVNITASGQINIGGNQVNIATEGLGGGEVALQSLNTSLSMFDNGGLTLQTSNNTSIILNALDTSNIKLQTVSGSITISGGSILMNGNLSLNENNSVTSSGSSLGTATPLTAQYNVISSSSNGLGVSLPAITGLGQFCYIDNSSPYTLNVYPNLATQTIDAASAGAAITLQPSAYWLGFVEASGTAGTWASVIASMNGTAPIGVTYGNGTITTAITGTVSVANGGTGASTSTAALTSLGAMSASVTSLPSVTSVNGTAIPASANLASYASPNGVASAGTLLANQYNVYQTASATTLTMPANGSCVIGATTTLYNNTNYVVTLNANTSQNMFSYPNYSGSTTLSITAGSAISFVFASGGGWYEVNNSPGVLPVAAGGTGVTTATGSGSNVLSTNPTIIAPFETVLISATALSGSTAASIALGSEAVFLYTGNPTATWALNVTGAPTTTGQSATVAIGVINGATAYLPSNITINTVQAGASSSVLPVQGATNNSITSYYQGGTAWSAADASTLDFYTITIICTGSSAWTLLLGQTKF